VVGASPLLADDASSLNVTVAIPPLSSIVQAIGADHVNVTIMVPPGTSPRTFEPSPRQMAALESADIYLSMGLPPEMNWTPQVQAARPEMPFLTMTDLVETRMMAGRGAQTAGAMPDPHVWLGPNQLRQMALKIRDTLSALAPGAAADFAANTQTWLARLDAVEADARARLEPHAGRVMLVYHPAFGYLADALGLRQVAIERQGTQPGPRRVAAAIETARAENVRVIFVQAQFSEDEARTIATEIDGEVVQLNPLHPDPLHTIAAASAALEASFR